MSGPTLKTGQAAGEPIDASCPSRSLELRAYRGLTRLARPLAPAILKYREQRGKEDPARRGERLGIASRRRPDGPLVWVHAASVGETNAVLPVMTALIEQRPEVSILLTTGTVTSAHYAASRMPPRTLHQYIPLDSPALVGTFLAHWRPTVGVFTEQEVWPNLVIESRRRGVPLVLVNARMSTTSFERWQRRPGVARELFSAFTAVLAQNEDLAQRFVALGARRVQAVGNLKIDAPAPPVDHVSRALVDGALGQRPRLLAASTHAGEEMAVARAHLALKQRLPSLVTIIVPRHPERGAALAAELAALGLSVERRAMPGASGRLPTRETDIYIADTIGELGTFYSLSPVAFIGGSLVRRGGQNPIEAIRHGAVVVAGPHTHNFADVYAALFDGGGAVTVASEGAMGEVLGGLIGQPQRLAAINGHAQAALAAMSGALARTTAVLLPLLAERRDSAFAGMVGPGAH